MWQRLYVGPGLDGSFVALFGLSSHPRNEALSFPEEFVPTAKNLA